jgi:putative intracellular protease/amidase
MNSNRTRSTAHPYRAVASAAVVLSLTVAVASAPSASPASPPTTIPVWTPRSVGAQPLVVVAGENGGTELTDFVIPYGVLKRAGIRTLTVAAHNGPLRFSPALKANVDATMAEFDAQHPSGADYVIVPAMVNRADPTVLAWLRDQARKGATVVSICDGALVVGNAGLLRGKSATAHWASAGLRLKQFPGTNWVSNSRYVADGKVISSAGISAAMPTSLALVEAISGKVRAAAVAREMEVSDWSPRHNSDAFRPQFEKLGTYAVKFLINPYLRRTQMVGVPVAEGMDEINVAILADAFSRTGRSRAVLMASTNDPVASRDGLRFLPDVVGESTSVDVVLPPLADTAPGRAFDTTLASIAARYGSRTAYSVALDFEYPAYKR